MHGSSSPKIIARLREKVGRMEGMPRRCLNVAPISSIINEALPFHGLPLGCIHEVRGTSIANAIAFASLLSTQISHRGPVIYIAPDRSFYPLGLPSGVNIDRWIHVSTLRPKDLAWTLLEALRCPGVKAVLAVTSAADLTFCRRLQLAAENSGTTAFLIHPSATAPIASAITRWQVSPAKSPVGHRLSEAFWKLELLYCRGGRPGKWMVTWRPSHPEPLACIPEVVARPPQRTALPPEAALAG